MNHKAAALKMIENTITRQEVEALEAMRDAYEGLKRRLDLLDRQIETSESSIIQRLDEGAASESGMDLSIHEVARRYPSWKSHFVAATSAEAAEKVLAETPPTITRSLIVRKAA